MNHQNEKKNSLKTKLLISVKNIKEISEEIIKNVDIIDLKDPAKGSIGAWEINEIRKTKLFLGSRIKISATLGDIFDNSEFKSIIKKTCFLIDRFLLPNESFSFSVIQGFIG